MFAQSPTAAPVTEPMILVQDLVKQYRGNKEQSLRGMNLSVSPGEFFGLLGPNGSGKTTLISILCGLLSASSGKVFVDGHAIPKQLKAIKPIVGLVPQEVALYPSLTLYENLNFFAGLYHLSLSEKKERIEYCIEVARLNSFAYRQIHTYSGGMKRRANLVTSLLNQPKLLFLDEPTVNVDPQSRHVIFDILLELNRAGTTMVYTTHYLEEAELLCRRIAIIDRGKLVCDDTPSNLIESHAGTTSLADVFLLLTGHELRDEP